MGNWSELVLDLLELIDGSLVLYADKIRIRAVCLSWHLQLPKFPNSEFPFLLHKSLDEDHHHASHALFNPIEQKFYYLDLQNLLHNKIFKGSSHGWVITAEDAKNKNNKQFSDAICLINPLTGARTELPSRRKFPDIIRHHPDQLGSEYHFKYDPENPEHKRLLDFETVNNSFLKKIVMSSNPSNSKKNQDCLIAAAIYGGYRRLACCMPNDKIWKHQKSDDIEDDIDDIIFHKGKLHAFSYDRVLVFENINSAAKSDPIVTIIATHAPGVKSVVNSPDFAIITQTYLVESCDASCLMIVERFIKFYYRPNYSAGCNVSELLPTPYTLYFRVYKVDQVNRTSVELKNIGENVLVVGTNTGKSISGQNSIGYKGNHIYFSESCYGYGHKRAGQEDSDMGVFDIENQTLEPFRGFKSGPKFLWPPAIWVDFS